MADQLTILVCDARLNPPSVTEYAWQVAGSNHSLGEFLHSIGIDIAKEKLDKKGAIGVFGLRKELSDPLYDGDRIEIYSPLLIDPMEARRKNANRRKDARLKAKAEGRKGKILSRS